jgi:ligand-binding sensor domain-containing protein/signal transduction histidine kinase
MASFFAKHLYIRRGQSEQLIMPKHHWTHRFAWLWLGVFFAGAPLTVGAADASGSPFIVDSWNNQQGLPQSSVISVIQTKDGYLWLGTLNGLVRFDGNRFVIFDQNNTPGLSSDRIVYLFEDSRTNLWIGTESAGFAMMTNGTIHNFGTQNGTGKIIYAAENSSGVWFHTADGLFNYHAGKINFYPGAVSTELSLLEGWAVIPSKSGGFWQLVNGTVEKIENNRPTKNFGTCPWGNTPVTSACEDKDGNLIVGTFGAGVFWYEPDGKFWQISTNQGLSSPYVLSLCMDRGGNLWAGTDGGGLNRIKRKFFDTPPEFRLLTARSISEDDHGGLWTTFNQRGISYWLTNSAQHFDVSRQQSAWAVLVVHRQQTWVGTRDEGLFQFQTNHFVPAPGAEILGQQIYALFETRGGQLWAGTQNGLARWDGQSWKLFTTHDGLSENIIRAIADDVDGNLWVGTESHGLNFFKDGEFISYHAQENGLPGNDISCLYADKDGVLWIGTVGHGLARFQNGKWTRYSTDNGLASDSISYLIEDDAGYLWIGSNMGLMRIQKKSLNDFAGRTTNSISCRTFTETDGLPTRECTAGSQPAAIRAHDGKLFFPTTKGLVSVNPSELKPNLQPPLVMIESVLVDDAKKTNRLNSTWPQTIIIPPGYEQLEINYTALNFSAPDAVRFKCWLEGYEARPKDVGSERVVSYPKLPPGDYRFHVYAANEDGVWNETGATLAITVQPWFWQTNLFRVAAIVFLLGIVIAIVRYISTQKLKREKQLHDQQERERARIARDLHDQLGANLTQVALLGEMAEADKNLPAEIELHAQQISHTARETTRSLDEIVWAVNPSNDTLEGLTNYACKYAQEYLALAGIRYRADVPTHLPATDIPPEVRHNVFLAFKESVNNVVKHAHASEAWIRLRLSPEKFILEIEDNGRGLGDVNSKAAQMRNGLRNMKKRMEDIHGEFSISPGANGGTIVRLTVPIILTTDKHR